ncbi:hypothetical protein A2U01_0119357, partial [Trifolium medium]|nr:hypothetical protein [Trifolium medium]
AVQVIRVRIGEDVGLGLTIVHRIIMGLTVLGTKGLEGIKLERS